MNAKDLSSSNYWAKRLGLAPAPLFESYESIPGSHSVLLDGGFGSFALSVSNNGTLDSRTAADWCWSSNVPHHVTVTDRKVAVVRWDKTTPELLTRSSVERQLDRFYEYLAADRVQSNQRVAEHMMTLFRRVRSLVADAGIDDDRSIDAYLAFLAHVIERSGGSDHAAPHRHPEQQYELPRDGQDLLQSLSQSGIEHLCEFATDRSESPLGLALAPNLVVRHSASEVFQEAHFQLLRTSRPDLFGYVMPAASQRITRGSTHFTPPPLARSIAEQALAQLPDLATRERLTLLDPACGSGSFLHEALRSLRRCGFDGQLVLHGRDISHPAVAMAQFVLAAARRDWSPAGGCHIDIQCCDSLDVGFPKADVILMNPPFVAWPALTPEQRSQMADILGSHRLGRGDLSMAFVTKALDSLTPGGVLGTLLPKSLLTLEAAESWRDSLLHSADLRFIASLGDYGIFAYARVQVAAAVLTIPSSRSDRLDSVDVLVAGNDAGATADGLRALRRSDDLYTRSPRQAGSWQAYRMSASNLARRSAWRLTSPETEEALTFLMDTGRAIRVGDIFAVRQGVLTGANRVFVLRKSLVDDLPESERTWFRPAITKGAIEDGKINVRDLVFYPYGRQGLAIRTEGELKKVLPRYFAQHLEPARVALTERKSLLRRSHAPWWSLSERRAWALDPQPRIVSKYFGGPGAFAMDWQARYIVVQGYAWFAKWTSQEKFEVHDFLAGYFTVMNSKWFGRLLEIFAPQVQGGQFNLSRRYVKDIPVPHLPAHAVDETVGHLIWKLVELGERPKLDDRNWRDAADRITSELFGRNILRGL